MRFSDKAIVLQAIKHGDKRQILKLYTRGHGLLTAITTIGKTQAARVRAASAMRLSIINAELVVKQNREIQQLTEASPSTVLANIPISMAKLGIAQFLNEILIKSLKEQHPNPRLFEFIENTLVYLNDAERDYTNLHLYFLYHLSKHLGFEPRNNYSVTEPFFDCREGQYSGMSFAFPLGLGKEDSRIFSEFMKMNCLSTTLSKIRRHQLLDIFMAYYRLHVPGFNEVLSLAVLKEVMSD
jgi:DNA repair protein RecO (recombination protein O)